MKLQIEASLKELNNKMKNKMVDKDIKKRLMMIEDFLLNLCARSNEVFRFCKTSNQNFVYALPTLTEKDQHSEAYQKALLYLEGIYQFVEFMGLSKQNNVKEENSFKEELITTKSDLSVCQNQLKQAICERDAVKKQCKEIVKQMQLVHEKCKLKKLHYKEVIRENEHLSARNKAMENELKSCESKISHLTKNFEHSKRGIEKTQKVLNFFKDKVHKMTIEINLLEKMNIEQSIEDENLKDKLRQVEDHLQCVKVHDSKLYEHVSTCNDKENCRFFIQREDVSFKYDAAKNLIKRMQVTLKKKKDELELRTEEISSLNHKITEQGNNCTCKNYKNEVLDYDGIIEENKRLWDGYLHLQMEQVSNEKEIEITENKYQIMKEKLKEFNEEKHRLYEEKETSRERIEEYIKIIDQLKDKCKNLEENLKQVHSDCDKLKDATNNEVLHLKTFLDQQQNSLREHELKFISLENEYLQAQEQLEEYKKSFENVEELLDNKSLEYEEKVSALSEELAKEKSENDFLVNTLTIPVVNGVVNTYIKMGELEECIENMLNIQTCQSLNDMKSDNNNYIENNNVIFEDEKEKLQNDERNNLYDDLKYKIENLRGKCENSVDRIIQNADKKLERYKMILIDNEHGDVKVETYIPTTYENIKLQISPLNIA